MQFNFETNVVEVDGDEIGVCVCVCVCAVGVMWVCVLLTSSCQTHLALASGPAGHLKPTHSLDPYKRGATV